MIFLLLNYVYDVQAPFFFFFQHVFILWHSCTWCLLLCTGKCRTRRHFTHTQQIEMWQKRWESCQIFRMTSGLPINDILLLFKVKLKSKSRLSSLILTQYLHLYAISLDSACIRGGQEGHLPPLEFPRLSNFTYFAPLNVDFQSFDNFCRALPPLESNP